MIDIEEFRAAARSWLSKHAEASPGPECADFERHRAWQNTLFSAGWLGLDWPEEYGGRGLDMAHVLVFAEELVRSGAAQPIGSIGLDVVGPTIIRYGTAEQCRAYLPGILNGDDIWCQGFSEPEAGSDLASLRTHAEIVAEHYLVNGQKIWTSWAKEAKYCALLARTSPREPGLTKHRGLSYLLADMSSPGITVRPIRQMTGDEGFCEVFFDDVKVPQAALLGQPGNGWDCALYTLSSERSAYVIRCRIEYETALENYLAAVRGAADVRELPDGLYREFGSIVVGLRALRAQTEASAHRLVTGVGPAPEDSLDKLLLARVEQDMYHSMLAVLSANTAGMSGTVLGIRRNVLTHGYLWSRAASIYGGTGQVQRNIVAQRLLGLPRPT